MHQWLGPIVALAGFLISVAGMVFVLGGMKRRVDEHTETLGRHASRLEKIEERQNKHDVLLATIGQQIEFLYLKAQPRGRRADV